MVGFLALNSIWLILHCKEGLPHPSGPLSTIISTLSVATVNEEVKTIVTAGENKKERGPYVTFSSKAKLVIARYAAENGIAVSLSFCNPFF